MGLKERSFKFGCGRRSSLVCFLHSLIQFLDVFCLWAWVDELLSHSHLKMMNQKYNRMVNGRVVQSLGFWYFVWIIEELGAVTDYQNQSSHIGWWWESLSKVAGCKLPCVRSSDRAGWRGFEISHLWWNGL